MNRNTIIQPKVHLDQCPNSRHLLYCILCHFLCQFLFITFNKFIKLTSNFNLVTFFVLKGDSRPTDTTLIIMLTKPVTQSRILLPSGAINVLCKFYNGLEWGYQTEQHPLSSSWTQPSSRVSPEVLLDPDMSSNAFKFCCRSTLFYF